MDYVQEQEKRRIAEAFLEQLKPPNKDVLMKMVDGFSQNAAGLSNFEAFKDSDGFYFAHYILDALRKKGSPFNIAVISGPESEAPTAVPYFVGIVVGIYLCELGKASLILRE